eukprot:gene16157-biopygen5473
MRRDGAVKCKGALRLWRRKAAANAKEQRTEATECKMRRPTNHPPRFGLIQSSPLGDGGGAGRRWLRTGTAMAKQATDGAVKAKGKQCCHDGEGEERGRRRGAGTGRRWAKWRGEAGERWS